MQQDDWMDWQHIQQNGRRTTHKLITTPWSMLYLYSLPGEDLPATVGVVFKAKTWSCSSVLHVQSPLQLKVYGVKPHETQK